MDKKKGTAKDQSNKPSSPGSQSSSQIMSSEVKRRGFTGSMTKRPLFQMGGNNSSSHEQDVEYSTEQQVTQVLWGTNINANEIQQKFRAFLLNFQAPEDSALMGESKNYYVRSLKAMKESEQFILNLNCDHLFRFDKSLYSQLINFPSEVIPFFDLVTTDVFKNAICEGKPTNCKMIQVRTFNLRKNNKLKDLGPQEIDKLVCIRGLVTRSSEIIPEMKESVFKCSVCGHMDTCLLDRGKIMEPTECKNCKAKYSYELIHNMSSFSDKQHIRMQELPDAIPEGDTPMVIQMCCYDDLVDYVKPGDRIEVTGIFRVQGLRVNPYKRVMTSLHLSYIDVVSYYVADKKRFIMSDEEGVNADEQVSALNEETVARIKNFAEEPNVFTRLINLFAPSICENIDVKKGILLQLFGGESKNFEEYGRGRFRGEINCLLVGDPSTAKSQLLKFVNKAAMRGVYTSGRGSSAVGLTAYISRDSETRELILESGALVLSDHGICCVDEFDKMDENTRVILHEAMEQQTLSIAKAGIICQLNARTAILAAANPIDSRYNAKLSVIQNIKLPPTLLSRFDLIYLMLDNHNETYDRHLADHIVKMYEIEEKMNDETAVPKEFLTQYLTYSRKFIKPVITDTVVDIIINEYVSMRKVGNCRNTITATPRQLESIIRLSEAHARMRLSNSVEDTDVAEAIRLIKVATQQAATDPETGQIDMDVISTGMTAISREKVKNIIEIIKKILKDSEDSSRKIGYKFNVLYEQTKKNFDIPTYGKETLAENEFRDALRSLEEDEVISIYGNKKAPTIKLMEAK